jgi:hypothetical protein
MTLTLWSVVDPLFGSSPVRSVPIPTSPAAFRPLPDSFSLDQSTLPRRPLSRSLATERYYGLVPVAG